MLSQKVTYRPGWNHEIAIGWRSKNIRKYASPMIKIIGEAWAIRIN